ncbi:MAG: hypothetical protein M1503_08305 [Thaumarchaeota archaeon]|nr:hypothetical protein [Nitrososphaerota archaeon]MCL5318243.1 hypothetical protein [Nitrososphaerota archaeon]
MLSSKSWITNCIILVLLTFSTFATSLAYAAPLANTEKDWQYVGGNSWGWHYGPQTQINKNNVDQLEVKWLFPIGGQSSAPTGIKAIPGISDGTGTPPIVRDGSVYVLNDWGTMYAVDAGTGKQKWSHDYVINMDELRKKIPVALGGLMHTHGFRYWEGGDALLAYGLACDFYGVDAKTGKEKLWVKDICKDVPGNIGQYRPSPSNTNIIGTYEKGRQFIIVLPSRIHSNVAEVAPQESRHVTMGISMDAPYKVLWRVFSSPPQDVPTKDWALQECSIGFFREIPCSEVAKVNQKGLEWDWSLPEQKPGYFAGVTANWGQPIVDEDTGIIYTNTGNQGPYSNVSLTPGPRLYGSTIMAIDMNAGKRVWWLQPWPHDFYDYDCNWSGILAESSTLGKVYTYGCKEGRYFVMDAANGKPKLVVDVRGDQLARGQISADPFKMVYQPDPKSFSDMREFNWISWPATKPGEQGKFCTLPCTVYPNWTNGIFQSDRAYDPETQTYILYEGALWARVLAEHSYFPGERNYNGGNLFTTQRSQPVNTTLVARDLATGKVKWTWFYQYSSQRAAPIVSGGMVITGWPDGLMRFFDKDSGKLIRQLTIGSPIIVQPTIGKDSSGNSKIFLVAGASGPMGAGDARYGMQGLTRVPGTLIAIGLTEKAATEIKTSTVTTTQSTTLTTTSATTQTQTTTVTSNAPAQTQTTTVTSQVTQTTGLPSEVTYAAVGIAVIAIIAAAVLVIRKK